MAKPKTSGARVVSMTEDEYLSFKGSSVMSNYMIDKERIPHGETARQKKKREAEAQQAAVNNYNERQRLREEYRDLVAKGKIKVPSKIEQLQKTARGNADNEAVQAARRLLKKRGYSW